MNEPRYIDANLIPYQLDVDEESPMEGALIVTKGQVDRVPTADVAPVVHSKWTGAPGYWHCPECGAEPFEISPYCPGCGAKMDESEEK